MGQQHYESKIQGALRAVADPERWQFRSLRLTSLRSGLRDARRYPVGLTWWLPWSAAAAVGSAVYRGGADLVHRFDLRLTPAAGREVITVHDLPPLRFEDEGGLPSPKPSEGARGGRERGLRSLALKGFPSIRWHGGGSGGVGLR